MNTNMRQSLTETHEQPACEQIPQLWSDERDEPFFRIAAALFSADFTFGAGVLLASYDPE
jgi:hypothetical protein